MKLKSHLCIAIVATTVTTFCGIAIGQEIKPKEQIEQKLDVPKAIVKTTSWGDADSSGLQMGASQLDENNLLVLCAIRNQGQKSVLYNLCFLGQYEGVSVSARPEGTQEWKLIPRKFGGPYEGIGPSVYKVVALLPGQQMPNYIGEWRYNFEPSAPLVSSPTNPITLSPSKIEAAGLSDIFKERAVASLLPPHTFNVYLSQYDWPKSWSGTIEFRVEQFLMSDKSRPSWEGTLKSGSLKLPVSALRIDSNDKSSKLPK